MGPELGPTGVIFLQGVRTYEPLRASLDAPQLILGRSTRKDLRKTVRVFRERVGEAVERQVVTTVDDLKAVLPELERLSAKTYQSRLLGLGIARGNFVERQPRFGVFRGIGRVGLLRVRGAPISFQVGYTYHGTYYATQAGYDPAWADFHAVNRTSGAIGRALEKLSSRKS